MKKREAKLEAEDFRELNTQVTHSQYYGDTHMNQTMNQQESVSISFQEGFSNDEVHILINGTESCRMFNVSTHTPRKTANVGIQDIPKPVNIEIRLPQRNVSKSFQLDAPRQVLLDVSLSPESQICYKLLKNTTQA